MKNLLILLLLLPLAMQAQDTTAVYLSFAPQDVGIGMRVDVRGGYLAYSYGNYHPAENCYMKDHQRIAAGVIIRNFTFGVSYHRWGEVSQPEFHVPYKPPIMLPRKAFRELSCELGGRVHLGRWMAAFRYDVLRDEAYLDFGRRF